jgi:hypothetical protein
MSTKNLVWGKHVRRCFANSWNARQKHAVLHLSYTSRCPAVHSSLDVGVCLVEMNSAL